MISIHNFFFIILLFQAFSQLCQSPLLNTEKILSLSNCNTFFQIEMGIGTQGESFEFMIDTGSLWSWIPSKTCRCGKGIDIYTSQTTNLTAVEHNITYADGDSVFGFEGSEIITFQETSLKNIRIPFVFVLRKEAPLIGDRGLIALGYSVDNIFDLALKQGIISNSIFSLQLSDQTNRSKLYFDKIPLAILEKSSFSPIVENTEQWALQLFAIIIQNASYDNTIRGVVIIDSGTTITAFNYRFYEQIIAKYFQNCSRTNKSGLICPLNTFLPTFQFVLKQSIVYLDPTHYSRKTEAEILVFLQPAQNIIFGLSFFKKYIVTFDKVGKRIGFYGESKALAVLGNDLLFVSSIVVLGIFGGILLLAVVLFICNCWG